MTQTVERQVDSGRIDKPFFPSEERNIDGVVVHVYMVPDKYDQDDSWEGMGLRQFIDEANRYLEENPDVQPPVIDPESKELVIPDGNLAAEAVYTNAPAMREWRRCLVPSAFALHPLVYPDSDLLPKINVPIDDESRAFFKHSLDARAIRSRAKVMCAVVADAVGQGLVIEKHVSIGSGTADPSFAAIRQLPTQPLSHLYDIDREVLDFSKDIIAPSHGLDSDRITTHRQNIIRSHILSDALINEIGEGTVDFSDLVGVFEYFDDAMAAKLLAQTYRLLKPGGMLVAGNMLTSHSQLAFNQKGIGWQGIKPRSVEELRAIVELAGIDQSCVSWHMADDGVYMMLAITKPLDD